MSDEDDKTSEQDPVTEPAVEAEVEPTEEDKLLAAYLNAPSPPEVDVDDDVAEEPEPSPAELTLSAEEQLQDFLKAGVPISQLALTTGPDGRLINCERSYK